ncbi:hypothetical protein IWW36_001909 [Coemansia brasiliensis]|uniref:MARVEL domain-containing protein n=1 Tax=Coemansia brasiliensis TaxID=2650707 RepID=A0A9W8IFV4_9FUNG|nr:hypothetical protein IWW36_001909 [Coemansia brasiliensis]
MERGNAYETRDVDITSMSHPSHPYAGSYSEATGYSTEANRVPSRTEYITKTTKVEPLYETSKHNSSSHNVIGMKSMDKWNATRFLTYVFTRLAQLVVALVCIGFQADSRNKRPSGSNVGFTQNNVEIAVYVIGGITAATALISLILHMFRKTRERIEMSRLAWFTMFFNFAVFIVWVVLVLVNVVAVDCSRKLDGSWCRSSKASLATGLISALFSLVVTLRSLSVLIRTSRIHV